MSSRSNVDHSRVCIQPPVFVAVKYGYITARSKVAACGVVFCLFLSCLFTQPVTRIMGISS